MYSEINAGGSQGENSDRMKSFGINIRDLRTLCSIEPEHLAKMLHITTKEMLALESGDKIPEHRAIAFYLETLFSIHDDIFGLADEKNNPNVDLYGPDLILTDRQVLRVKTRTRLYTLDYAHLQTIIYRYQITRLQNRMRKGDGHEIFTPIRQKTTVQNSEVFALQKPAPGCPMPLGFALADKIKADAVIPSPAEGLGKILKVEADAGYDELVSIAAADIDQRQVVEILYRNKAVIPFTAKYRALLIRIFDYLDMLNDGELTRFYAYIQTFPCVRINTFRLIICSL